MLFASSHREGGAAPIALLQGVLFASGGNPDRLHRLPSRLNRGALAGLGPGAYSVDARFFGRRVLRLPHRR